MRDPVNRIVFEEIGRREGYLVGGYLRDAVLRRKSRDRDYVVRGGLGRLTGRIAFRTGGSSFTLGRHQLHRIVLPDGATLDFSPLDRTVQDDLSLRDFSINALAWSPRTGLIDPAGGQRDILAGVVRVIHGDAIARDPLRLLRAYRISQELGFVIEKGTRSMLRGLSRLLEDVACERISMEFFRILNGGEALRTLRLMRQDGMLERLIILNNQDLLIRLKVISKFWQIVNVLPVKYHLMLQREFSQGLRRRGLLILAVLLGGGVGHRLCISSAIEKRIAVLDRAAQIYRGYLTPARMYEIFEAAGDAAGDLLILRGRHTLMGEFARYKRIVRRPFLSAEEICRVMHASPGPVLGAAIRRLRRAQFIGSIRGRRQALKAVEDSWGSGNLT